MQIVQAEDLPVEQRIHQHRKGTFRFRRVLEGEPGTPGNFSFQLVDTIDDFFSPRHRHNFEQYRYQLEGTFDFSRDGTMKPGVIGYFPEATSYGPQTSAQSALTAVLQFGGPSGSGYLAQRQAEAGAAELKKLGRFEDGIFKRNEDVEGKRNMDGYQAVWEHVNQRPLVYPKPRYSVPVLMDQDSYQWVPVAGQPGVSEKLFGVFTEFRAESGLFKLDPGATFRAPGRGIYFALSGGGTVEGQPVKRYTAVFVDIGEQARFVASDSIELLHLGMPNLALLQRSGDRPGAAAQAAE